MKKTMILGLMATVLATVACTKTIEPTPATNDNMTITVRLNDGASKASFTDNAGTWKFAFTTGDVLKVWNSEVEFANAYTYTCSSVSADAATFTCATEVPQTTETATWYAAFGLAGAQGEAPAAIKDIADSYVLYGKNENVASNVTSLSFILDPMVSIIKMKNWNDAFGMQVKFADGTYWNGTVSATNDGIVYGSSSSGLTITMKKEAYSYTIVPAGTEISLMNGGSVIKSTSKGLSAGKYYVITLGDGWVVKGGWDKWTNGVKMTELSDGIWLSEEINFAVSNEFKFQLGSNWVGAQSNGAYWLGADASAPHGDQNLYCNWAGKHRIVLDFVNRRIYYAYGLCGMIGSDASKNWNVDVLLLNDGSKFYTDYIVFNGTDFKLREYGSWDNYSWGTNGGQFNLGQDYECSFRTGNISLPSAGVYRIAEFHPFSNGSNANIRIVTQN